MWSLWNTKEKVSEEDGKEDCEEEGKEEIRSSLYLQRIGALCALQ
jgi:hypothetical protein